MANIKSAKKRIKTIKRNHDRKRKVVLEVKKAFKLADKAVAKGAPNKLELVKLACKKIDKAVSNGLYHKNTAARHKSRLVKKLNKVKS